MHLVVDRQGSVRGVYAEAIDLSVLGNLTIRRASHVEPDGSGRWWADLTPVGGPTLGPFDRRSEALATELQWLDKHWCGPLGGPAPVASAAVDGADNNSRRTTSKLEDPPWD